MVMMNSIANQETKIRLPYRAPTVVLVLHHSKTRTQPGTGNDGGTSPNSLS